MARRRGAWASDSRAQLGEDPGQGFKTLVTLGASGAHVVCCVPVAGELDFKAAARAAGEKRLPCSPQAVTDVTGYVRGGCSLWV